VEWIGRNAEAPDTDVLVGLSIDGAREAAETIPGIEMVREVGPNDSITFDYRQNRLTVLVVDAVVMAAARF
jgi:hypothetical protein